MAWQEPMYEAQWTRRAYLRLKALADGVALASVSEAVSSVALTHPEWDLDEVRTWDEWEADQ